MSTVQAGDVIAVYRSGKLHNAPADMSTVQDTDLIVVGRGNVPYKCTVADWRASQGKPPAIYDVLLADSPEAGRFTSGTFASTVDMAEEGVPPATKGIKGWVEGSLKTAATSPAIASVSGTGAAGSGGTVGMVQWQSPATASPLARDYSCGKIAQDAYKDDPSYIMFQWADSLTIGGYSDWYVPSFAELNIIYVSLKPTTAQNSTTHGANQYAVPKRGNYSAHYPAQTTAVDFKSGGPEAFATGGYWTANEFTSPNTNAWQISFHNGSEGGSVKGLSVRARVIRRISIADYVAAGSPAIGTPLAGGFYGGQISTTKSGTADYALIVSPAYEGSYGVTGGTPSDPYVLGFSDATDLDKFAGGDAITEVLAAGGAGDATGVVSSVDVTAKTITLAVGAGSGTWDIGNKVKGPMKVAQITPTSDEIVAVSGTGSTGTGGTPATAAYNSGSGTTVNAQGKVYGKTAQDANNNGDHPVFQWAAGLNIGGHTDWYIPALNELEILYRNLKPDATANRTTVGANANAVPSATSNYTAGSPARTTVTLFQAGSAEAFVTANYYWSATEDASNSGKAWGLHFHDGMHFSYTKGQTIYARAIRRVAYTGSEPAIGSPYEGGYFGGLISTTGTGVADYALIVAPNRTGSFGYAGGTDADPYVLTFKTDKDLAEFSVGLAVNQDDSAASGTVASVDVSAKKMTMAIGGTGTWGPANTGKTVVGPKKPSSMVKLFCKLDTSLTVTDLQSTDPGFTAVIGAGPYTITFPATLPSGNPPDTDLPAGTTLTTEVQATNHAGTSDKKSTPITPA